MDPVKDVLYVANEGYQDILVFNQPQNCNATGSPPINCNVQPDRTIYNTSDFLHTLDGPSALAIDFSADQIYLSTLGLFNDVPSLLVINNASTLNGQAFVSLGLIETILNLNTFPLNYPEALALDPTK